ncbi:MAG TPA: antitoxin Xre/MbcA/ParS toxin-binding domain-containing protein [Chitinolyticbacter sp.]|uniref:type II RES/Xre toxin-antitoxin system antitoxin n=1 Tax=Chitinolyticbacter albus TaxID=2961951 RepID=UPI00210BD0CA|nr:antitoxin Xre/MbcA/ParS toxin-binding domain-containing protein [Chitinolyticbacter albus]HSC79706.1 antitoxin Xre/MbcA/ParS toxin-binding domain-containing protein [Chitinolyticbacter sp.]
MAQNAIRLARLGEADKNSSFRLLSSELAQASPARRIALIREGMSADVLQGISDEFDIPKQAVYGVLHLPASTAARLTKENKTLGVAESERVARIAEITDRAVAAFGDAAQAKRWLTLPSRAFNGATPFSMLDTEIGAQEVRRVLVTIQYGGVF